MAFNTQKQINLNIDILPREVKRAFIFLSKQKWIGQSDWYLAGGTALALLASHRKSVDLDFFTTQKKFDNQDILNNFLSNKDWKTDINKENTIYGSLFNVKISFIVNPSFIPKQEFIRYSLIKILQPIDIAVMKIIAISQRGRKRDFFDVYWCAKNIEPLEYTIKRLSVQYPSVAHDFHHILKSLVYFFQSQLAGS